MKQIYTSCCGIDVHKNKIVACLINGQDKQTNIYGAESSQIRELSDWLLSNNCEMVAMESTASYWKPLANIFDEKGIKFIIINPHELKMIPGHKTDISDAQRIAEMLAIGVLKGSFIPSKEQRELRDIVRYRGDLVSDKTRHTNRLQKILESSNIKLGSKVSSILGNDSRALLEYIIKHGTTPSEEEIATLVSGRLKVSAEELFNSLDGIITRQQRTLLKEILEIIDFYTEKIEVLDKSIAKMTTKFSEQKKN